MDLKTKGKEGTNAKGQQKENANLVKVNKKLVNDGKSPGKEKKDDADDISNSFPNFGALNEEEKLAFFEALSAARKNIEKRGLPTRERFGTVHDEYLHYFARDDKKETVQKKPESAPSASRSPVPTPKSPKESFSPKQRAPREPAFPPKRAPKPPQQNPRPESEPNDLCEAVIKRDTDHMIQMYLDKKKRIEEQWKKDAQASKTPPPVARKNRDPNRPPSGRPPSRKEDPKPKTPTKPLASYNTPQFQAFNPNDRKDFLRLLKEAHANIVFKGPHQQNDVLALDEVLKPYKGPAQATTACPATQVLLKQQQQKNLRVKVTLTSADNKRLACRTKSQVLNDSTKEGSGGKSKSLESLACPDVPDGKQSKIPILKKAPQERNDGSDIKKETQPVKKVACEDSVTPRATEAKKAEAKKPEAAEAKKTEAPIREKALSIKEEPKEREEIQITAKEKKMGPKTDRKAEEMLEECCCEDRADNVAELKKEKKTDPKRDRKAEEMLEECCCKDGADNLEELKKVPKEKKTDPKRDRKAEEMLEECCCEDGADNLEELKKVPKEKKTDPKRDRKAEEMLEECCCEDGADNVAELKKEKKTDPKRDSKAEKMLEECCCKDGADNLEELKKVPKEKKTDPKRDRKAEEMLEECCCEDGADNLAELKKVRKEKEKIRREKEKAMREKEKTRKEKEKALAEAAKKEKDLLRKKKKQESKKRHQKKETPKKGGEEDCMELKLVGVRIRPEDLLQQEKKQHPEKKKSACEKEELATKKTSKEKGAECEEQEQPRKQTSQEKGQECREQELLRVQISQEKGQEYREQELLRVQVSQEKGQECREQELLRVQTSQEKGDESEEKMSGGEGDQKGDCLQKEQEEEEEEEDDEEKSEEGSSSEEVECQRQQSKQSQVVPEVCQQQSAGDFSNASARKEASGHLGVFSSLEIVKAGEQIVTTATHSMKSLAGVSLLEKRPEETWQTQEIVPTYTTGKVVVVDDNVIKRIKDLIQYLDRKVNAKDNLQSEYVRLVLSYTEYLTKVTESLILAKKPKKGQQVHSTYAAPEVRLKFHEGDGTPKGDQKKPLIPHSISEAELQMPQGPSGIEKKEDSRRKASHSDFDFLSDSGSSSHSEDESRVLTPSFFRQANIPMTKIRLLQDLLNGRAKFEEGSINDFKIVHMPEGEYVPPEKPKEVAKEISEADVDQGQKILGMKFLRNLVRLCNCGKKQVEEDAILENLKGEAVRVDTVEPQKDPASATINDSTMEVLKAAERKRIIEKYLKREQS